MMKCENVRYFRPLQHKKTALFYLEDKLREHAFCNPDIHRQLAKEHGGVNVGDYSTRKAVESLKT